MNPINQKIEILPENIIDQIKAGEVIERPSSLIKELIENSIDANSSEIHLHLIENGLELISIEDNGNGIDYANLPYAFARHATSKLKKFEDIYALNSFGFRGEALASIASIARVTCQSQPLTKSLEGGKIIINGGKEELLIPTRLNKHGTSIFIKDLFYNTPARLKFIKSKNVEKIQLKKIIYSFVISNPQIHFSIKWDQKEKEVFPNLGDKALKERVKSFVLHKGVFGDHLLQNDEVYQNYKVECFFSLNASKNSPYKNQYIFINKRLVLDKNIHQAVLRATDQIWKYGESGNYIIFIEAPLDEIDVNVHPNKTQIKFLKSDIIFSLINSAHKKAIKSHFEGIQEKSTPSFVTNLDSDDEGPRPYFGMSIENQNLTLNNQWKLNFFNTGSTQLNLNDSIANSRWLNKQADYWIDCSNTPYRLLSIKKLLAKYFEIFISKENLNDEEVYPLLISEPVKNLELSPENLNQFKNVGFELEKIAQSTFVLRTIPKNFDRNLLSLFFECLRNINNLKQLNVNKLISALNKVENLNQFVNESIIEKLINEQIEIYQQASVELNESILGKLFE